MSASLSFYAFEPSTSGVPPGSGTGVFVTSLVSVLESARPQLDVRLRWLRPAAVRGRGRVAAWRGAARWLAAELIRPLSDRADYLLFVYPKLPVLAHVEEPHMLDVARHALQILSLRSRLFGPRIVVVVEDLPIELAEGRARAGGQPARIDAVRIRAIEHTLFRAAYRLIVPSGLLEPIRKHHGLDPQRFRTFRRNIYLPGGAPAAEPPFEFEGGRVNFFYSGSVDAHVASNFREILRSIRNAPETRLHVCGPGREAVEEWMAELKVPNVRHHGQLSVAQHDWLAQRCDVGLILYPSDNPYNHLTPTMKYSAYLANGLAILSTDLRCVAENVRHDGVGQAMPIKELALELLRWATRPALWSEARTRARAQSAALRSGHEMRGWITELAGER
jgi:hypothetical protein